MRRLTAAIVTGGLFVLAGCAPPESPAAFPSDDSARSGALPPQSVVTDEVTIEAEPNSISADSASIKLTMDTHTTPLDMALPSGATLTVAGRSWRPVRWDGDAAGGHHREGTVQFAAARPAQGVVTLSVGGLSRRVVFRWTLPSP